MECFHNPVAGTALATRLVCRCLAEGQGCSVLATRYERLSVKVEGIPIFRGETKDSPKLQNHRRHPQLRTILCREAARCEQRLPL